MDYDDALAYLAEHSDYETTGRISSPTLERIGRLLEVMGDPHRGLPAVHITGSNGKGSTAHLITRLLMAQGLRVGTFTSPHLERVNERIARDTEPIGDDDFAEQIAAVADAEVLAGVRPSYFEICTAAAFRWFADAPVDVMVVEVGLLGRWDATNVIDASVAVVTNVALEHTDFAGPTRAHVAAEKAGIVKPGAVLVLGETDPGLRPIFAATPASAILDRDVDFACVHNELALGGRLVDLRTPRALHRDLFLRLHGAHQADNAAAAVCATEAFFGAALDPDVVTEAFAGAHLPGRFEVLGHQPLVVVDGAHNPSGADVVAEVMTDDFDPAGRRILVVGMLEPRDPVEMLEALRADEADLVICTEAPSPRAVAAERVAQAARAIGIEEPRLIPDVAEACDAALAGATGDDAVLVTGSLYVVGAARSHLRKVLP